MPEPIYPVDTTPFQLDRPDASAGVLLCHGFTGSPASVRPWGEYLYEAGLTVHCPLLPGHGTSWQDMNRTTWRDWYGTVEDAFHALRSQLGSRPLFAMGLSMGGTLVTRLAQVHQDQLSGIVLVNPSFTTLRRAAILAPILSRLVPSIKGLGGDIKQDQLETGTYNRTPLRAFASLRQLWRLTRANLASIRLPVAVFHSAVDHVVEPINTQLFLDAISSTDVTATELPNSYHVATLDHDAPTIFSGSLEFVHRLVASPEPEGAV